MLQLGRWLLTESGGPASGLTRVTKRAQKLKGPDAFGPLMAVLGDVARSRRSGISDQQKEALEDVARVFRIR